MNIYEEKAHIYEMMRSITEERRDLTKMYYELKSRLDHLITLETKGLEDISIKGIVDLHNAREVERMKTNIERESANIIRRIEKKVESNDTSTNKILQSEKEVEEVKEKVVKKNRRGRGKGLSVDKAAGVIAHVLKEHGTPMRTKDLFEAVNGKLDVPITKSNFNNNVLPRSAKLNKRINNASRGYWQYLNE